MTLTKTTPKKNGMVDWATVNKDAKKLLEAVGSTLEPTELVKNLSVANKQMVEIAKALSHNAKIILMDEPSATLTQNELKKLFEIIRDLKVSQSFISLTEWTRFLKSAIPVLFCVTAASLIPRRFLM